MFVSDQGENKYDVFLLEVKKSLARKKIIPSSMVLNGPPVLQSGLGRVLDESTRVQVQVLEKMTSTSTNTTTGFSKILEYKYKYFEKCSRTSTEYVGYKLW